AHVGVVVVEDEDRAGDNGAGEHVVGSEDVGAVAALYGLQMGAADAVLAPAGAGGEHDVGGAELLHIGGGEAAVAVDADVGHALDLADAVVAYADPLVKAGQLRLMKHAAAQLGRRFGEMHAVAALAEGACAFEAGGAGADDQYGVVGRL